MVKLANEKIEKKYLSKPDYKEFNLQFNNLISIKNCIEIFTELTDQALDKI